MQNAVRGIVSGCMVSYVNPEKRSNTEKTDPPPRVSRTSSTRGITICGISVTFFSFSIVDRDSDATGLFWNAYEGAGPWRGGVLDESGGEVRVENGVYLLRENRVQSTRP